MKLRQQEIPMPINIMAGILLPMRMRIIRIFWQKTEKKQLIIFPMQSIN